MKSYTTLEQAKKLTKILPIESADMWYCNSDPNKITVGKWEDDEHDEDDIPCWSLAALFGVLPFHLIVNNQRYAFSMVKGLDKNGEIYAIKYAIFNMTFYFHLTNYYNNPVDACVEMILKLKEMNLI